MDGNDAGAVYLAAKEAVARARAGVRAPYGSLPVGPCRFFTAGADVVIECSGIEATGILAGRVARRKGRVVVMGVFEEPAPLDYTDLVYGEKTVMDSMGSHGVFDEAIQVMAEGKFDGQPLITGNIGLDDILGGFDDLIKHKEENVKILVSPS